MTERREGWVRARRLIAVSAALVGLFGVPGMATAACLIVATPIVFGTISLLSGGANDSTAAITVTCPIGTGFSVGLDNGANFSGTRRMKGTVTGAYIPYTLSSDVLRASPWGNTVGTNTVGATAGALPTILTAYGRVPAGTTPVPADAYLDLITITVTF